MVIIHTYTQYIHSLHAQLYNTKQSKQQTERNEIIKRKQAKQKIGTDRNIKRKAGVSLTACYDSVGHTSRSSNYRFVRHCCTLGIDYLKLNICTCYK